MYLGDKKVQSLGAALKYMENSPSIIDLSGTGLKSVGAADIINNLTENTDEINFANNRIGFNSVKILSHVIKNKQVNIKYLNIENNNLGNAAVT